MPRKTDSNNPADWLYIAESDLEGLRVLARTEAGYEMCTSKLAEVIEKTLKAELIRLGWFLVKTHDLLFLAAELDRLGSDLTQKVKPLCEFFAERYYRDRYPGFDLEDPDWPQLNRQIDEVGAVFNSVKSRLAS